MIEVMTEEVIQPALFMKFVANSQSPGYLFCCVSERTRCPKEKGASSQQYGKMPGRVRRSKARRSSGSVIAANVFMDDAG